MPPSSRPHPRSDAPEPAPLRSVAVYCSSSTAIDPAYAEHARSLGVALAERGLTLVYGGGSLGLMGELARACRASGGEVVGVITERLKDAEMVDDHNSEVIVVPTMRERKRLMESRADAFAVLPGGLGTLEEVFEILVGRLLGEHDKPIALLNCADPADNERYFAPLLEMFEHMSNNRFMSPEVLRLVDVVGGTDELLAALDRWRDAAGGGPERGDLDAMLPGRLG